MKKRITAIILAMLMGVSMFPLPIIAYASDTAQLDVSLTLTESDVTPPHVPPSSPSYIVYIPASISLNEKTDIEITWENNNLVSNEWVNVYIDGTRTFPDGLFYLQQGDGSTPGQRITCAIWRGAVGWPLVDEARGPDDVVVAQFDGATSSTRAATLGRLVFQPYYSYENVAGTYTGTIHFKIEFVRY